MKKLILILSIISACMTANAQLSGGGDLNPDLKAPAKAQEQLLDMRVGMSIHWGPSAIGGKEIGWSRGTEIPVEVYDNYYKEFAPSKFNADEWCRLAKRWGMRYISPTAKHHDGFSIWFSDYSPYDMEATNCKTDIMGELKKACDSHGLVLGAYYSNIDWYHPDWTPYSHGGPGQMFDKQADSPNTDRYFKYMENQVLELIRKYDLAFIQFDGEWDSTYTHEIGSYLYRSFHKAKPDILLNSRIDVGRRNAGSDNHIDFDGSRYAGDFQDRERLVNRGNNVTMWGDIPWQAWVTIDKSQWGYNPNPKLMTSTELIRDMVNIVGSNGNYMINVAPRPDGSFEHSQIALMDTLGMWLDKHGEAIYGTRGGPYYPFEGGVSTRNGKKAWLLISDTGKVSIELPRLSEDPIAAYDRDTKAKTEFEVNDDKIIFTMPPITDGRAVRVIELRFRKPVGMQTR